MQRFRGSVAEGGDGAEADVETCLHLHAHPQGIARLGFGLCLQSRLPAGTDVDRLFRALDTDRSRFLNGREFGQLERQLAAATSAPPVATDGDDDSSSSLPVSQP